MIPYPWACCYQIDPRSEFRWGSATHQRRSDRLTTCQQTSCQSGRTHKYHDHSSFLPSSFLSKRLSLSMSSHPHRLLGQKPSIRSRLQRQHKSFYQCRASGCSSIRRHSYSREQHPPHVLEQNTCSYPRRPL